MPASSSTTAIDAPGHAPDTQIVKRPAVPPLRPKPPVAQPPKPAPAKQPEPTTAAPEPKADPVAVKPQEAAPPAEAAAVTGEPKPRRLPLVFAVPSWLVSLTVHLIAVMVLALLTIPPVVKSLGTFIEATAADELVELIEPTKIVTVDLKTTQFVAADLASTALVSESMADAGQLGSVASNLAVGDVDIPAQAEIGDLFSGEGGKAMGSSVSSDAKSAAQFFGVKATGRRFVFVVDSSNSMRGAKFTAAKEELMYAIRRLSKEQAFYIIFFDANSERMLLMPDKEPPLLPVPATSDNIHRVEYWINGVQNELKTNPFDSVKFALEMVPDAIYLLTDGKFTDRGQTERFLKANNLTNDPVDGYRPKVVIHTICFGQGGEETLKAIAKDYGGTYRSVPVGKK